MKEVYIIGGANGSGKTTFAKEFVSVIDLHFLNADEIAKEFDPDNKDGGKLEAGKEFFKRLDMLINNAESFAMESTLSGLYMKKVIARLRDAGYEIRLLYVFLDSPQLSIDRVKIRVNEGGHNIPENDIVRRYYRSRHNFWHIYRRLADEWQLFYNGEDNTIQVACGKKDESIIINEELHTIFIRGL